MKVFYLISAIICAILFVACIILVVSGIAASQGVGYIILDIISGCIFAFSFGIFYLGYERE